MALVRNYFFLLLIALLLLLSVPGFEKGWLIMVENFDHAIQRHGVEAQIVLECINRNGAVLEWLQSNGRIAKVCRLDDGRFGILIETIDGKGVTAFIKNKFTTLEQVLKYLSNKGGGILWMK